MVAGIGNIWRCEALFLEGRSPWAPVSALTDDELDALVSTARRIMTQPASGPFDRPAGPLGLPPHRPALPAVRARSILSRGQGEQSRTAYWCPTCQPG